MRLKLSSGFSKRLHCARLEAFRQLYRCFLCPVNLSRQDMTAENGPVLLSDQRSGEL